MQSDRDRVLEATDLVALIGEHIALRPKGREHVGLCPFHDDRTPSLAVVTHKESAFYKCFACGAAGNAIDFMMNYHRMEFPEALRALAQRAGIELRRPEGRSAAADDPRGSRVLLRRANEIAQRFFRQTYGHESLGGKARRAVESRRLPGPMVKRFGLGASPEAWDAFVRHLERLERHGAGGASGASRGRAAAGGDGEAVPRETFEAAGLVRSGSRGPIDGFRNRLMFPICDELGNTIAFGARAIDADDPGPKYINSPESAIFQKGRSLYGMHLAKRAIIERKVAVICEGYTDCIACHHAGFEHTVATLGTSLTRDHAKVLQRLCERVILLFDGDDAGMRAADRAVEIFFAEPIDVQICTLPDGLDPDELLRQEQGAERFAAALEGAVDALTYLVRRFEAQWRGTNSLSGRQQRLEAMLAKLGELGLAQMSGVRKRLVLGALGDLTGIRVEELEREVAARRRPAKPPAPASLSSSRPTDPLRPGAAGATDAPESPSPGAPGTASLAAPASTAPGRGGAAGAASAGAEGAAGLLSSAGRRRARIEAERNLLALLLADPSLAEERVATEDGLLPIVEAFVPSTFEGPGHTTVAEVLWRDIESGNRPTLQRVLAELADAFDKSLASDLFSIGSRRLDPGTRPELTASQAVRQAAFDLERILRRESFETTRPSSDAPLSPGSLLEELERLRRLGPNPAAIARGGGAASTAGPRL